MPALSAVGADEALSFIDNFQAEMDRLGCAASVHASSGSLPADTIELRDETGQFVTLLPETVTPETAVLAFGLYKLGRRHAWLGNGGSSWTD